MTSAGTGNLLLSNPPFIMATNLPPTYEEVTEGLPKLTEEQFQELYIAKGGTSQLGANSLIQYRHALWIAQSAFHRGAFYGFRRAWDMGIAKPPTLKEQALAILDDCSARLDAAHENTLRRALEALPE